ncbi:LacI family DNA-binding transcriptional regulator [Spirabiliibacterium falconis]|uniref:LacI family DNA-binding transcriptional regulator n=1 Tax=Spirabiliibacterium falconis TaxID=572023 RepID=UPI001AAE05BC|nr:LacI family DNA-binding transcriptional regulator [Spirabiliibacterium falconis]MBE2894839.1 LacI family DNA-binding transcriptional regulator [Spirabiliibacterium falconis]
MMKKVTIADIAQQAGCSKTTISRYLNGKYDSMSEQTKQTIATVIAALGYRPNQMARNLRLQKSRLIGVLVSDIKSPFSSILYSGIADECERHGYTAILASTGDSPEKERMYMDSMIAKSVEGLIVNATGENVDYLAQVNRTLLPVVLADRPLFDVHCDIVTSDTFKGMQDMLAYVYAQGYEHIIFVTMTVGTNQTRRILCDTFCTLQADYQQSAVIIEFTQSQHLEAEFLAMLATHQQQKIAFFAANGLVLQALCALMKKHHLNAPEDIGLCGVDNWAWMELAGAGMTVLEQPTYEMGKASAQCLIQRIQGKADAPVEQYLSCQLIKRGSI